MSKLKDKLSRGEFVVTGEVGPPKGTNIEPALHEADLYLKNDKITAANVTDLQTAVMRASSLVTCLKLKERGIEPILQMVCRDRNRLALQSELLSAAILGIENVLALTGDHVMMGDHKGAMPVYDLDSVGLLQAMALLEKGTDLGRDAKGNANVLDGVPKYFKGAVVAPCADDVEPQILKLEAKVAAGAQFIQTQAVYDPKTFEAFIRRIEHLKVPVLLGIVVLKGAGMAKYMNRSVPGVFVPEPLVQELASAPKESVASVSVKIAGRLIREMKGMCQGAHLMTLGWDRHIPDILAEAQL